MASAKKSPIGWLPNTLDVEGLSVDLKRLLEVDPVAWRQEANELFSYFQLFKDRFPRALLEELDLLTERLK